jgi:sugar phosphate isomerase/epimerase
VVPIGFFDKSEVKMAYKPYIPNYTALSYTGGSEYSEFSTGYKMLPSAIGAPTKIDTANQIADVSARLNEGMRTVEVGALSPEVFETIPKQQFKEIRQLAKLTGSEMTVHAPIVDPAGFSREGWSESQREEAERQLIGAVMKSSELGDKNVNVTIHASGIPAWEWQKNLPEKEKGKAMMVVVNQETGQLNPVRREERFYPGEIKVWNVQDELDSLNETEWSTKLVSAEHYKKQAEEILHGARQELGPIMIKERSGEELSDQEKMQKEVILGRVQQADRFLQHVNASLKTDYHIAYKYDKEHRKVLEESAKPFDDYVKARKRLVEIFNSGKKPGAEDWLRASETASVASSSLLEGLMQANPKLYAPVEEFFVDHAAKTISNVAFKAYKELGEKAPIIALENFFPEIAFSRADQLRNLVEHSKKQFICTVIREKHLDKEEAERIADKLIGVTWDVGHINLLRKGGYGEEEIVKETKKIASLVKKVHITDNFGFNDTHLPPGMGNVPMKKMMEEMEKKGFSGKSIMEAGGFVAQFKVSPHPYVLEAMGSPIYGEAGPSWAGARGASGGYFSGYGPFLPEQHFSMYGTGFSSLPTELGGQIPGKQSRFAGTPVD